MMEKIFPTVWREWVETVLDDAISAVAKDADAAPRLVDAMRYALLSPGKRLRPVLVLLAAAAVLEESGDSSLFMHFADTDDSMGGVIRDALRRAVVAVEAIHAYSLIHDDLPAMDNDDLRRGRPTCHRRFDDATTILAGDALQTLAFEMLAGIRPAEHAACCGVVLARSAGVAGMAGGQMDDIGIEKRLDGYGEAGKGTVKSGEFSGPDTLSESRREMLGRIHARKTGALIIGALLLGATLADAGDDSSSALRRYGAELGLLFQITDDLLDLRGDSDRIGKTLGKDTATGKLTYPGLLGESAARCEAGLCAERAVQSVAGFHGPAGDALRRLADAVLQRDR